MEHVIEEIQYEVPKPLCKQIQLSKETYVSKVLLKENQAEVTINALPRKMTSTENKVFKALMIFVVEGTVEVIVEGRKHIVTAGETIRIQEKMSYVFYALEDSKWMELSI